MFLSYARGRLSVISQSSIHRLLNKNPCCSRLLSFHDFAYYHPLLNSLCTDNLIFSNERTSDLKGSHYSKRVMASRHDLLRRRQKLPLTAIG